MIYAILFLLVICGFMRTVSFGFWNLRKKNISGGVALLFLGILSTVSSLVNLLS